MKNIHKTQNLLDNVGIISKKYDDIAKITGENFNIFSVMNMEWSEVNTHSAIIGELLNPKGSHGQGDVFLNLFIHQLNQTFSEKEKSFKLDSFQELVGEKICERHISNKNLIKGTGGRIDIIIEDKNQIILIENKPGNQDQELQLIRYYNYAKVRNKKFKIFYLTIDGRNLNEEEVCYENEIEIKGYNFHYSKKMEYENFTNIDSVIYHKCLYYPISFHTEIRDWLEKCHKEAIEQPILRETIKQYLNLVKKLTNQTINDAMSDEILKIIENSTKESFTIFNNILGFKRKMYLNFMNDLKEYATSKNFIVNDIWEINDKEYGLFLTPELWKNKNINICIIFEKSNYKNLYYGVSFEEELSELDKSNVRQKFKKNGFEENPWWIWKYVTNRDWENNGEVWEDVSKGKNSKVYNEIITAIDEIIEIENQQQCPKNNS